MRAKEHFYVIDNTDYPEAVLNENYIRKDDNADPTKDHLFVRVDITTTYTSNDKFFFWNLIFLYILCTLGALLIMSTCCYCWKTFKYNRYVKERRLLKQELIKVKDTEYTNFLMR